MLNDLERILVQLYDTSAKARHVIDRAAIPAERVDLDGAMRDVWHGIIAEAIRRQQLTRLVEIVAEDYPQRVELQHILYALRKGRNVVPYEEQMSDRWGGYAEARLGERVSVLETRLPLIEAEINRRLDLLSEGQSNNRAYSEKEFGDLRALIMAGTTGRPTNDRAFYVMMAIGALVVIVLIAFVAYWIWLAYKLSGGQIV